MSFGATKNGAMAGEAVVAFNPEFAEAIERGRKRGGHLLCKGRYPAAQLLGHASRRAPLPRGHRNHDWRAGRGVFLRRPKGQSVTSPANRAHQTITG